MSYTMDLKHSKAGTVTALEFLRIAKPFRQCRGSTHPISDHSEESKEALLRGANWREQLFNRDCFPIGQHFWFSNQGRQGNSGPPGRSLLRPERLGMAAVGQKIIDISACGSIRQPGVPASRFV